MGIVLLAACAIWAYMAVKPTREQAQEYRWLAVHGVRENDRVAELGWQEPSGAAKTVIVTSSTGIQAFVDLKGGRQKVTTTGGLVSVVLDMRESPAVGTGVAVDLVSRSFVGDYVRDLAPPVGTAVVVIVASGAWLVNRRRTLIPSR